MDTVSLLLKVYQECDISSFMGKDDEVVLLRIEAQINGKHVHVFLTDKQMLYGANQADSANFISYKLPSKEGSFFLYVR